MTGKAKLAIADVAYSREFHRDILKTLECKFGRPQVVVGAYFDKLFSVVGAYFEKLSSYAPVTMHHSEQNIIFANFVAGIIGVFRSLNYESDLKGVAMSSQAVCKLPPNLREQ